MPADSMLSKARTMARSGPDPSAARSRARPEREAPQKKGVDVDPNVSAEEQQEYERVAKPMYATLYDNERTSEAIVSMLSAEEKVGSVARAALMVIKQLDERLDMAEVVVATITMDAVDELLQIAEAALDTEYSEAEAQQALAATWEGVMILFGGDGAIAEDYERVTQGMSEKQIVRAQAMAQSLLEEGESPEMVQAFAAGGA